MIPNTKLGANFDGTRSAKPLPGGGPAHAVASDDGDLVFFQTTAALLPGDDDGEVAPEGFGYFGDQHASDETSVSGDIYEWRADWVDGCALLQGCLALITNGQGGYLNILLGSAEEGKDVFIYTSSQLVPQDNDQAATFTMSASTAGRRRHRRGRGMRKRGVLDARGGRRPTRRPRASPLPGKGTSFQPAATPVKVTTKTVSKVRRKTRS